MVPNAGVANVAPIIETDLAAWRRVTSVNLDGVFLSLRYAAPAIIASGGGSIVSIASVTGTVGSALISSYAAAKAAVINLTETAATELREHGVRVNAVAPGFIATELVTSNAANFERHLGLAAGDFGPVVESKQGRFGTPDDVARAVAFLADPQQSWVTGSVPHARRRAHGESALSTACPSHSQALSASSTESRLSVTGCPSTLSAVVRRYLIEFLCMIIVSAVAV